ncbi:MAG: AAA family ATPase [Planctomycetes bacterium]|nr:AAA family ATPase [Planctomycetota bacterium]
MFVVAFAGLPGSGKSTLARALGLALGAPVLDKDRVRAALYEPGLVEYASEQDDIVCAAIHTVVREEARRARYDTVVLDGRTYARRAQVDALLGLVRELRAELVVFHCACSLETAERRVARNAVQDATRGVANAAAQPAAHPAANRGPELVRALHASFEALMVPHRVIDTELLSEDEALAYVLAHVAERRAQALRR